MGFLGSSIAYQRTPGYRSCGTAASIAHLSKEPHRVRKEGRRQLIQTAHLLVIQVLELCDEFFKLRDRGAYFVSAGLHTYDGLESRQLLPLEGHHRIVQRCFKYAQLQLHGPTTFLFHALFAKVPVCLPGAVWILCSGTGTGLKQLEGLSQQRLCLSAACSLILRPRF